MKEKSVSPSFIQCRTSLKIFSLLEPCVHSDRMRNEVVFIWSLPDVINNKNIYVTSFVYMITLIVRHGPDKQNDVICQQLRCHGCKKTNQTNQLNTNSLYIDECIAVCFSLNWLVGCWICGTVSGWSCLLRFRIIAFFKMLGVSINSDLYK